MSGPESKAKQTLVKEKYFYAYMHGDIEVKGREKKNELLFSRNEQI